MSDDWEDWENQDYSLTIINSTQQKELDERKLVEESDNKLTNELFGEEDLAIEDLKKITQSHSELVQNPVIKISNKTSIKVAKKELHKKLVQEKKNSLPPKLTSKQLKAQKQRERELFGEAEHDDYDKYAKYDEMFY